MADSSGQPEIFISYSHKDLKWLEYVHSYLSPAVKHGVFRKWDDRAIRGGADWRGDISERLNACDICVLLVSPYSLSSDFILDVEVKRMLERRSSEGAHIYPIVVRPTPLVGAEWLKDMNLRPRDGIALSTLSRPSRDTAMVGIVNEIAAIVQTVTKARGQREGRSRGGRRSSNRAEPEPDPAPGAVAADIDTSRLPLTPYKNLVGREDELKALDRAWADDNTNIISLIAWGGAGKTALINEWLTRLRDRNYRGAEAVLGWCFYSQGTKERSTSADGFLDWAIRKLDILIETPSASLKGEKLAETLATRRILLVLDGVEPLQHGPGAQEGQLKDQGLRILLRRFAATPPSDRHGLIVMTSRLVVGDILNWKGTNRKSGSAPVLDLARLSDEAGAALLADNGVKGSGQELRLACHDFDGHALALSLLASFLVRRQNGDIRRRDLIGPLLQEANVAGHGHARRVMQAYHSEWLQNEPVLNAIMLLVGLFDRPASAACLKTLRDRPVINGLTEPLVGLDLGQWADAVAALREVRLLDPEDTNAPGTLDTHPLVREWFGERLAQADHVAWRSANSRLYDWLRTSTKEGDKPTLASLAPLYQAIVHGCRANRHQDAMAKIYIDRICRWRPDGEIAYHASSVLGAIGSNLSAIWWFFEKPYEIPVATLEKSYQYWVLSEAGFYLRSLGRLTEALAPMRIGLQRAEEANDLINVAIGAGNISEVELTLGEISAAVTTSAMSVEYADRSGAEFQMVCMRATYGDALCALGSQAEAEELFLEAERRQIAFQPQWPVLYSLRGYLYCDLLVNQGRFEAARERAQLTAKIIAEAGGVSILDQSFTLLMFGRVSHRFAIRGIYSDVALSELRQYTETSRSELDRCVESFRQAGALHHLPRGMLARAAFRRSVGNWDGATRDLDEVLEIAEPGPMKLFLCDMALERARLDFAQIEAFTPLNGVVDDSAERPERPSEAETATLKQDAARYVATAADYIATCGYHKRDQELAELQEVLGGERPFASLPPRA